MTRRNAALAVCLALFGCLCSPRAASAEPIGLTTPLSGTAAGGDLYTLTVSFDPNGSSATNIVSMELFLAFAGLVPVPGSFQLGSIFGPYEAGVERFGYEGVCAEVFCSYPEGDGQSPNHFVSTAALIAPLAPTGPGTLFTIQLSAIALTAWTLDVIGDSDFGLMWDPLAATCSTDPDCVANPLGIPFVVAMAGDDVGSGLARINLRLDGPPGGGPDPTPVPEPGSLLLFGAGAATVLAKLRRRTAR